MFKLNNYSKALKDNHLFIVLHTFNPVVSGAHNTQAWEEDAHAMQCNANGSQLNTGPSS